MTPSVTLAGTLLAGMLINAYATTAFAERFSKYSIRLSLMLIVQPIKDLGRTLAV